MRIAAPVFALLLMAQTITNSGQPVAPTTACIPIHKDVAVNNQLVLVIPAPPRSDLYTYICDWEWQAVQDATGTAQTNVLWTTTNLGGVAQEYSTAATANGLVSGTSNYAQPHVSTSNVGSVIFTSPAAAAHVAYSLNVSYRYGRPTP